MVARRPHPRIQPEGGDRPMAKKTAKKAAKKTAKKAAKKR
jgi:hypothetical protein